MYSINSSEISIEEIEYNAINKQTGVEPIDPESKKILIDRLKEKIICKDLGKFRKLHDVLCDLTIIGVVFVFLSLAVFLISQHKKIEEDLVVLFFFGLILYSVTINVPRYIYDILRKKTINSKNK